MGSHHPITEEHDHHHHHHDGDDTYYLDQLCMVALSGAFGVICLSMWFLNPAMLNLMLAEQFHIYVLLSGIALCLVSLARAWVLWIEAGKVAAHDHDHSHEHEHANSHEHHEGCAHDHCHDHDHAGHDHAHDHAHDHGQHAHHHHHGHDHAHDHSAEDHDHGWAPWRYVVMLTPIILFMLGLPSMLPRVQASISTDHTNVAEGAGLVALGSDRWAWLAYAGYYGADSNEPAQEIKFGVLESLGAKAEDRAFWNDKMVSVVGMFSPKQNSNTSFDLVRFKINCCLGDAIPLRVPVRSREELPRLKPGTWVEVRGRVQFYRAGTNFFPVLSIASARNVREVPPDPRPHVP